MALGGGDNLSDLAQTLSFTFIANYSSNHQTNPSIYLSEASFTRCDKFRDSIAACLDSKHLIFTEIGDELPPDFENDGDNASNNNKRAGTDLEGPSNKKRKLNDGSDEDLNINMDSDENNENDSDIISEDDDDENDKEKEEKKRKKIKLREKYRDDEDFQALEAPPIEPSKANQFFDPIHFSEINLEYESRLSVKTKKKMNDFYDVNNDNLEQEGFEYFDLMQIEKYLKERANKNGFTVQSKVTNVIGMALSDYLKNMFDEMNKWRIFRMDQNEKMNEFKLNYDGINCEKLMDEMNKNQAKNECNEKKQQIEKECKEMESKQTNRVLTKTEEQRLNELKGKSAEILKMSDFDVEMTTKCREIRSDTFYVVDAINVMENYKKRNQAQIRQLSKLYLRAT